MSVSFFSSVQEAKADEPSLYIPGLQSVRRTGLVAGQSYHLLVSRGGSSRFSHTQQWLWSHWKCSETNDSRGLRPAVTVIDYGSACLPGGSLWEQVCLLAFWDGCACMYPHDDILPVLVFSCACCLSSNDKDIFQVSHEIEGVLKCGHEGEEQPNSWPHRNPFHALLAS